MEYNKTLYLLPSSLGESDLNTVLPANYASVINNLKVFFVEDIRTARRFLRKSGFKTNFDDITFIEINEHTNEHSLEEVFSNRGISEQDISKTNMGVLSEAGLPCIADPGALVVAWAHKKNIKVKPICGPSSIFLALMASGMNGQNFKFHGYLPIDKSDRCKKLKDLENIAKRSGETQIFIETPYRNQHLFESIINTCSNNTLLCIAMNISLENEYIHTYSISQWKKFNPNLHKQNAVFLIAQ